MHKEKFFDNNSLFEAVCTSYEKTNKYKEKLDFFSVNRNHINKIGIHLQIFWWEFNPYKSVVLG